MIEQARRRKWTWAGHVSRILDHIYTLKPYEGKQSRRRQWRGELNEYGRAHLAEDSARETDVDTAC